jgi:hypothetical protein
MADGESWFLTVRIGGYRKERKGGQNDQHRNGFELETSV